MDDIKTLVIGTIVTVIIGGTAYTVSQSDIVNNFADDTGMTQEQAERFITEIPEEQLTSSFAELGYEFISGGQMILDIADEIDCINYEYEWESFTLSCFEGKTQMDKIAKSSILLGEAYVRLDSYSEPPVSEIKETIRLIDQLNSDYNLEIVNKSLDWATIDEVKKTNSYNKALLQTALESIK